MKSNCNRSLVARHRAEIFRDPDCVFYSVHLWFQVTPLLQKNASTIIRFEIPSFIFLCSFALWNRTWEMSSNVFSEGRLYRVLSPRNLHVLKKTFSKFNLPIKLGKKHTTCASHLRESTTSFLVLFFRNIYLQYGPSGGYCYSLMQFTPLHTERKCKRKVLFWLGSL